MLEIARQLTHEMKKIIPDTTLADEHFNKNKAEQFQLILIVAPHEFFELGEGSKWVKLCLKHPGIILYNTEQRTTPWFAIAYKYFRMALAILDIDYHTSIHCRNAGYNAYFLPPASSNYFETITPPTTKSPYTEYLPDHALKQPTSFAQRYFDILFIGANTPRREKFFANNSSVFAKYNCFIHLPEIQAPLIFGHPATLDFQQFIQLARNSKIVLNIHRDDAPYFEWQRIVNLGMMMGAFVISDTCTDNPIIRKNIDYADVEITAVPNVIEHYLQHPEEMEEINKTANLQLSKFTLSKILHSFLNELTHEYKTGKSVSNYL